MTAYASGAPSSGRPERSSLPIADRHALRALQRAKAIRELILAGETEDDVAEKLLGSPAEAARWLKLLELPDDVQAELESGALSVETALVLTTFAPADVRRVMKRYKEGG